MLEHEKITVIELCDMIRENIRRLKECDKNCDFGLKEHSKKIDKILCEIKTLNVYSVREVIFKVLDDEILIGKRLMPAFFDHSEFLNHVENIKDGIKIYGIKET